MSHIDVEDSLSMIREKRRILRAISKVYQCLNLEGKRMAGAVLPRIALSESQHKNSHFVGSSAE